MEKIFEIAEKEQHLAYQQIVTLRKKINLELHQLKIEAVLGTDGAHSKKDLYEPLIEACKMESIAAERNAGPITYKIRLVSMEEKIKLINQITDMYKSIIVRLKEVLKAVKSSESTHPANVSLSLDIAEEEQTKTEMKMLKLRVKTNQMLNQLLIVSSLDSDNVSNIKKAYDEFFNVVAKHIYYHAFTVDRLVQSNDEKIKLIDHITDICKLAVEKFEKLLNHVANINC